MHTPPSKTPKVGKVGDRLEGAIGRHVDIAAEIEREEQESGRPKHLVRTVVWLTITVVSLYLVAPSVLSLLDSWDEVQSIGIGWIGAMVILEALALLCLAELQYLSINGTRWRWIVTSQLAGNAMAKIAPGGGAIGAALQYRMLARFGVPKATTVAGLTAANVLTLAVVLAMPIGAIPAILRGLVPNGLLSASIGGAVLFVVLAGLGAACMARDRPLEVIGRGFERVRNRLRPKATPMRGLPRRLLTQRDGLLTTLGPKWRAALAAAVGRWAFEYAVLVAALASVGAHPRPALILLAFCAAQLLAQIPITPGGLGFVEAGLATTLVLAGVSGADAAVATFAYRLISYWLPLPVGLFAFFIDRRFKVPPAVPTGSG